MDYLNILMIPYLYSYLATYPDCVGFAELLCY